MGIKLRKVITGSGKVAVQVVSYHNGKREILKHIGTADNEEELTKLLRKGTKRIQTIQIPLPFDTPEKHMQEQFRKDYLLVGNKYLLMYETLSNIYSCIGFDKTKDQLLKDLTIVRIVKPTSKKQSAEILNEYFGVNHSINKIYKQFKYLQRYKKSIEQVTIKYVTKELKQDIHILFYDVTTLYFESFTPDELRQLGFSKDNKFNQPQIVLGLVTTNIGFPITYQLFNGKKFEGHSMLPIIKGLVQRHKVKSMTVVADAAMISQDNVTLLENEGFSFIVGARLSNLRGEYLGEIYKLNKTIDNQTFDIKTHLGTLVVQFSRKRYRKDKHEFTKACKRAEQVLKTPSKISRRYKYVKKAKGNKYELNTKLLTKQKKLLGLKGYYTNTKLSNKQVIERYKNLWKIEQNFRVLKSDMKVRPLYHWKPSSIQSHILLCFVALCISKFIEIKTNLSIKEFVKRLLSVIDTVVIDKETGTKFLIRQTYPKTDIEKILKKLSTKTV